MLSNDTVGLIENCFEMKEVRYVSKGSLNGEEESEEHKHLDIVIAT